MDFPTTQENKEKLVKILSLRPASALFSLRFYSRASSFSMTFLGSSSFKGFGNELQLCCSDLSFDLLHANSILSEPKYLFILENNISSSTALSNNVQNLRGQNLLLHVHVAYMSSVNSR